MFRFITLDALDLNGSRNVSIAKLQLEIDLTLSLEGIVLRRFKLHVHVLNTMLGLKRTDFVCTCNKFQT